MKMTQGIDMKAVMENNMAVILEDKIEEIKNLDDSGDFEFTMIGGGAAPEPPKPVGFELPQDDEIQISAAMTNLSPFKAKKAKKKKKKLPNFENDEFNYDSLNI